MTTTTHPVTADPSTDDRKATPEELAAARVRWGLDAAPTAAKREQERKKALERELTTVRNAKREAALRSYGTPADFARALLDEPMPNEWQESLRRFSPKSDTVAYLDIFWKQPPGQTDKRRLVIYEMVPDAKIPTEMRMRLGGTPYWELPAEQRPGREAIVSPFQWVIYQRRREWARPLWCVQGDNGGTPMAYSELETDLLRLKGQPTQPPALGALSFAPYDGRVEEALRRRDRLWKFAGNVDRLLRDNASPEAVQAEYDAAKKEFRREFLKWWGEQLQEQTEFLAWYETKCESDHTLRRASRAEFLAAERLEETYIEHGYVPQVNPFEND